MQQIINKVLIKLTHASKTHMHLLIPSFNSSKNIKKNYIHVIHTIVCVLVVFVFVGVGVVSYSYIRIPYFHTAQLSLISSGDRGG